MSSEEQVLVDLLDVIEVRTGVDLHGHARAALMMRLRAWLLARALDDVSQLVDWVRGDVRNASTLAAFLGGRAPRMFADVAGARLFRSHVAPLLRTYASINVWLPECASGEEVFEMTILLREENLLARSHVYATDPNHHTLELAQAGRFSRGTIAAATFAHQQSGARASFDAYYRRDGERVHMMDALRERVTFSPHSFVTDASFNEFHLVLCRDVLLNYDSRLHVRACTVIHDSVKRLGFLVIGRGESMNRHPKRDAYERVGESNWYRRLV